MLNLKCGYDVRAASILINESFDKQAQMEYAKNLGYTIKRSIDEGMGDGCNLFIIFSHLPEIYGAMTALKSTASILAGIFAIPLGVLIFYFGIVVYNTPPAFGIALAMIAGGPILAYVGYHNRQYLQWLKC